MSDKVLFDPGFAPYVENFSESIDIVHQVLFSIKNFNQKKMKYKLFQPQLFHLMKNNICFYKGCLMWAFLIKNQNINTSKEIEGNAFLGMSKDDIENYDFSQEIDFLIAYFETYERDSKYYLAKKAPIPDEWKNIAEFYKEFIELNNGFVAVKSTAELKLPLELAFNADLAKIEELIKLSIQNKNLEILSNSIQIAS